MGQTHSYEEFMPEKVISDSFDGLDPERIEWEKKIGFFILLEKFGSFGFFESSKHKNLDNIKITRTDIKKFLESFDLEKYVDWIEQIMPDKIIKIVSKDLLNSQITSQIEKDPEYMNLINPLKYKLIMEKYDSLTPDDKIKIYPNVVIEYQKLTDLEKIEFVDKYFIDCDPDTLCLQYYLLGEKITDVSNNKELKNAIDINKYLIFRTKYYDELDDINKAKYTKIKLDYNSHWELYKLNEKKYMKIFIYNTLIDDYTFSDYHFDNFNFLNSFNEEVKTYLKNKIKSDNNYIVDTTRHTKITTLNNFIDIMYFIHNPPAFLRTVDRKYYSDYIDIANKYLEELNYDFGKITYLNMVPRIVFDICN